MRHIKLSLALALVLALGACTVPTGVLVGKGIERLKARLNPSAEARRATVCGMSLNAYFQEMASRDRGALDILCDRS